MEDEWEVLDDYLMEANDDGPWFYMWMSKKEKIEARRLWRNSVIIKLVGRRIGYQYLLKCIQAMWKV